MRILVHDYSGHPFQAQLSAELARRGHDVTHSWCRAYVSGKGKLIDPEPSLRFEPIGIGRPVHKGTFWKRLLQEVGFGIELARQARRLRPDVTLVANAPIPTLVVLVTWLMVVRRPWVLWHQDVQAVAVASFAGGKLSRAYLPVAWLIGGLERWCARRATAVVAIAESFTSVHARWGTADKLTVIPNWAPLDEIVPVRRDNPWAKEHDLAEEPTLLYAGTLGLKHNPTLLVALTARVRDRGLPVRLVVVNEGPAVEVLRDAADLAAVPVTLLPYQPYERLADVLGTGDVLVVLLDRSAGEFSVPSKTLSYLCAGRPVLGLMSAENLAAMLVLEAGGQVLPPGESSLDRAADWVAEVLRSPTRAADLGFRSRELAEREFALSGSADRFEQVLRSASHHAAPVSIN